MGASVMQGGQAEGAVDARCVARADRWSAFSL